MRLVILVSLFAVMLTACGTTRQASPPVGAGDLVAVAMFTGANRGLGDTHRIAGELASVAQRCWLGKATPFKDVAFAGITPGAVPTSQVLSFVSTDSDPSKQFQIYIARSRNDAQFAVLINLRHAGPEIPGRKVLVTVAANEILKGRSVSCNQ